MKTVHRNSPMHHRILLAALLLLLNLLSHAQSAPALISYQAVVRDNVGNELSDQAVTIEFAIRRTNTDGIIVFEEYHDLIQTNQFGLFNTTIGSGIQTGNGIYSSIAMIPWSSDIFFLEVRAAIPGQGNTEILGVSQLLTVPYSLYSEQAGTVLHESDGDSQNELIEDVSLDGNILTIEENENLHSVDLSSLTEDADSDPANETISSLSFNSSQELEIVEGGTTHVVSMENIIHSTWQGNEAVVYNTSQQVGIGTDAPTSDLTVEGSLACSVTMLAGEYYDLNDNASNESTCIFLCDVTTQDVTVGLVAASSCPGRIYKFRKMYSGTLTSNDVSIVAMAGDLIDGLPIFELTNIYAEYASIVSNGDNWFVIDHSKE